MAKTENKMELHSYFRSSCSWRVRLALEFKNIPYKTRPVHLLEGEQHEEPFVALSPMHQVPVLRLPQGEYLSQSVAIFLYLESLAPEPSLSMGDTRVVEFLEIINSGVQPLQNFGVLNFLKTQYSIKDPKPWGAHFIKKGLTVLEQKACSLAGSKGEYVFGVLTAADMFLVPQIYNALRFEVDVKSHCPSLWRVYSHAMGTELFQNTAPQNCTPIQPIKQANT